MSSQRNLWIKNLLPSEILLFDMGIYIPASSFYQVLPVFELDDIQASDDLVNNIQNDNLLLSEDGMNTLSKQDSIDWLTAVSQQQLDDVTGGSGITPSQHRLLDQLVHDIAETSYYEPVYDVTYPWRVNSETYYTDNGKSTIIRELLYTYTDIWKYNTIVVKQWNGGAVTETLTGTVTYSGVYISNIEWVAS